MSTALTILLFLAGIALIVKGGDIFVDAAAWIAEISGIPKLIIGATVVSLATTLPEMLVSTIAAAQGKVDMSLGNAVGSVTANIGLIMAISLLCMPTVIRRGDYLAKALLMLWAAIALVIGGLYGKIGLPLAAVLFVIFAIFIYENIRSATTADKPAADAIAKPTGKTIAINAVKFIAGAAGIVIGADLLVDNGSELARLMGVSERIIGVTMVAIGTSLPELVTTVSAIVKKQPSLSVGNILGANILDLTLILPLSAAVSGQALPVAASAATFDLPVCLLVGLIATVPALICSRFRRWQGAVLLVVYAAYIVIICTTR